MTTILYNLLWSASLNLWIIVGEAGVILSSPDGINWTQRAAGLVSVNLKSIVEISGVLVAAGDSGVILTSPDGINWTQRASGTTANIIYLTVTGGYVYLDAWVTGIGDQYLARSVDGVTWTQVLLPRDFLNCTFAGFVQVGNRIYGNGYQNSSSPGSANSFLFSCALDWTDVIKVAPAANNNSPGWYGLAQGNGYLVKGLTATGFVRFPDAPSYGYNTATQFAIPDLSRPSRDGGIKRWIKVK